ncbi:MAG: DUF3467 domain-containing protein [Elusimicrobia bacterium]|nr:DUF3467 domain-containing protein [Elusimicrobiota bacterium]
MIHPMTEPQDPQIQIEVDEAVSRGIYSNLALIAHSETEFVLDFVFLQPQNAKAKVLSRIVSSPSHAKRLLWALKDNIEKYEARFGPIRSGAPAETPDRTAGFYQ